MAPKKSSAAYLVLSIISLVITGHGAASLGMIGVMVLYAGSGGGSSTAVTNEAVLGIAGVLLFIVLSWIFSSIGGLMGFVLLIVGLAKKYFRRVWMPAVSMGVSFFIVLIPILMLMGITM